MALVARNWAGVSQYLANGTLSLISGSSQYRVLLFNGSATDPDASSINSASPTVASVKAVMGAANELQGAALVGTTGYTYSSSASASGQVLTGVTWTQSSNIWTLSCTSPSFGTAQTVFNPAYAVFIYCPPGTPADSACLPLVYWNLNGGTAVPGQGGTYVLTISGSGLLTLTTTG